MELTTFLAVWGALLSTIAVTWNMLRDFGDRGKLKIDAMIGKMYPDHTDRDYLVITITNVGKRSVLVKGWGGMKRKDAEGRRGILITPHGLPKMLDEGQYHIEWTPDFRILSKDVERVYVWDSSGREWKVPRKVLKQLKLEAAEMNTSK